MSSLPIFNVQSSIFNFLSSVSIFQHSIVILIFRFQFQFSGVLIPHLFFTPTLLRLFLSAINMIRQTLLQYCQFVLYEFGCVKHPTVSAWLSKKDAQWRHSDIAPFHVQPNFPPKLPVQCSFNVVCLCGNKHPLQPSPHFL